MDRAVELFNRIKTEGVVAIESFISDRQMEELFLDFKRSSNNGATAKLAENDRKNLSKAISGFGNSEGGVIVWGVDCSLDADGADVAHTLVMLEHPARFASLLQRATSGCTLPPHTTVEHTVVERGANTGFVVTLIPKSNSAPHQSVSTRHYYIRAGSDFVPIPHDVLAGMFGRRPQPHVFPHFALAIPTAIPGGMKVSFGFMVHNEGPGVASDVFAICRCESSPSDVTEVEFEIPDRRWEGAQERIFGQLSLISPAGFRLPPGANAQPIVVHLSLRPPFTRELRLFLRAGASEARTYDMKIKCPVEVLQAQTEAFSNGVTTGQLSNEQKHAIAELIVKDSPA